MEYTSQCCVSRLGIICLMGYVAIVFSLWHVRQLHTHIQWIMQKAGSLMNTVCRALKDTSFPTQFRYSKSMSPQNVLSTAALLSFQAYPAKYMAPCTLTDLIVPETHILTNVDIALERENFLRMGGVPEEAGNREKT